MRKLILLVLFLLLAVPVMSQVNTYGVAGVGSFMQANHKPCVAMFFGGDISIYQDTAAGFATFTRPGMFYADRSSPDIQGAMDLLMVQKSFNTGKVGWFVATGGGVFYDAATGSDQVSGTLVLEFGPTLYKALSIGLGAGYIPINHDHDQIFTYVLVDLFP